MKKSIFKKIARFKLFFRMRDPAREARLSVIKYSMQHIESVEEIEFQIDFKNLLRNHKIKF